MNARSTGVAPATALLLAGQREGAVDALAAEHGLVLKCLVPVAGRPMILHVLDALAASPAVGRILVSINDPAALERLPAVRALQASGRLGLLPAQHNLVDSVLAGARLGRFPLFVTTADNVLLGGDAITAFADDARSSAADVAVAFARAEAVLAAHPDGQRRFYRFACGAYSNCNSYWIGSESALAAAEVFRSGGQFAKHPARIVGALGLLNLIRFRLGIGTLDAAFRRFSRRFGLRIVPLTIADGAVAIDVDNARTRDVAEMLLVRRRPLDIADAADAEPSHGSNMAVIAGA